MKVQKLLFNSILCDFVREKTWDGSRGMMRQNKRKMEN